MLLVSPSDPFPQKVPIWVNWHFLAKKAISEEEFQKILHCLSCCTSWKPCRHLTVFCPWHHLQIVCPALPRTDQGQFWLLQQRKTIVECVLFCYFRVVQPENNEERIVFLWLCNVSYWWINKPKGQRIKYLLIFAVFISELICNPHKERKKSLKI